jgi:hypothetical protein
MCPRCGYDVQGDADRWNAEPAEHAQLVEHAACPLEGTCPECGFRFSWAALMRPGLVSPVWFTETSEAYGRKRWSGVRTLLHALRPWRFWWQVRMETPINLRRQVLWLVQMTFGAAVTLAIAAVLLWTASFAFYWFTGVLPNTPGSFARGLARPVVDLTMAFTSLLNGSTWYRCVWVGALVYPLLVMLLSQSRKLAKVQPSHVLRAAVYACAIWPAMLALGWVFTLMMFVARTLGLFQPGWSWAWWALNPLFDLMRPSFSNHALYPIVMLWFAVWWGFAIRSWRMPQAWMVWLAVTVPSVLIQAFALLASVGFRFPGMLGDSVKRWFLL